METLLITIHDLMAFLHDTEDWLICLMRKGQSTHLEIKLAHNAPSLYETDAATLELALTQLVSTLMAVTTTKLGVLDATRAAVTDEARAIIAAAIAAQNGG